MRFVKIYMEGGGDRRDGKNDLRLGMEAFLGEIKKLARSRSITLRVVPCGGRQQAFRKFVGACRSDPHGLFVLLVDSEGPVNASPRDHLTVRDRWNLFEMADEQIHLMVQTMETWIVADSEALIKYYGQGFRANVLPVREDLEKEDKTTVADALGRATEQTQKGRYHKIRHAGDLLASINPKKVQARCRHCKKLFAALGAAIAAG